MLLRLVLAALLIAHGAVHAGFLAPAPPPSPSAPAWPFTLDGSRALSAMDRRTARLLAAALVAVTTCGFALAAIGVLGFGPAGLFTAGIVMGSVSSIALLILFFHPWLLLGIAIDVVLLFAALVREWTPASLG